MSQGFQFAECWTPTNWCHLLKNWFAIRSEETETSGNECINNFWCRTLDIVNTGGWRHILEHYREGRRERRKVYLKSNVVADLADFDLFLVHGADVWLHLYNTPGRQSVFPLFLNQWRHKVGARGGYTQIHLMQADDVQTDLWSRFTSFSHLSCTSRVKSCSVALFFSFFVVSMSALFRMSVEEAFPFSEATIRSIWIRTVPVMACHD